MAFHGVTPSPPPSIESCLDHELWARPTGPGWLEVPREKPRRSGAEQRPQRLAPRDCRRSLRTQSEKMRVGDAPIAIAIISICLLEFTRAFAPAAAGFAARLPQPRSAVRASATTALRAERVGFGAGRPQMPVAAIAAAAVLVPIEAGAEGMDAFSDRRVLATLLYTLAHLPILVPFFSFWKVDRETKMKGAAFGAPLFVGWIALLGGWLRF